MILPNDYVTWLKDIEVEDRKKVGDELSYLGELAKTIPHPKSFVVTPEAFLYFKTENNLELKIKHLLGSMDHTLHTSIHQIEGYIKKYILQTPLPHDLVKRVFSFYERLGPLKKGERISITAYFLKEGSVYKKATLEGDFGEAVVIEKVRTAWAEVYEREKLAKKHLHHDNHSSYSVALLISKVSDTNLEGTIQTVGEHHEKHLYTLHAHSQAKLLYDKHNKKIIKGYLLDEKNGLLLSPPDIQKLIDIAHKAEQLLYHPYNLRWGKYNNEILLTAISPLTTPIEYYTRRERVIAKSHHPGIKIGRIKFFDPKKHELLVSSDEIIVAKSLDKKTFEKIKKASALIVEDDLSHDAKHFIKQYGIPTVSNVKDAAKTYREGEVVTVNATNGHVQRGSMAN